MRGGGPRRRSPHQLFFPFFALPSRKACSVIMFDDWEELEVEEEEPEVPSQKHEVAPAEVGGVALAEMAPFLRDFELSSGSGAAERSEVDEGGGRGRELAMGSGRAPREEDKEEECVTIEEVFVRDTGAGEPARAHEYDDDVDGGEGYGRLEGSNLVLLPGPIGQLQRALKRRRERDGGLRLQRSGAGQAATTLVPAGRASEDALDLVRGMEDEQDFAGVHWRRAMDALDAKDTSDGGFQGAIDRPPQLAPCGCAISPQRRTKQSSEI